MAGLFYLGKKSPEELEELAYIESVLEAAGYHVVRIPGVASPLTNSLDLLISYGGDGTLLRAATLAHPLDIPILGISKGTLGFLTEIQVSEVEERMAQFINGKFIIDERKLLETTLGQQSFHVLNDVLIRSASTHMIELEVYLEDQVLTTYRADALIISSSTGSTAYNLSSGGPIVYPGAEVIILTPVCSHSLTVRPLVLSAEDSVKVKLGQYPVVVSLDGKEDLSVDQESLVIRQSQKVVRFIRFNPYSFIDGLRYKLHWSGK